MAYNYSDLVGGQEIVGGQDIVGALRALPPAARAATAQAILEENSVLLRDRAAGPRRRKLLPSVEGTQTAAAAGESKILTFESQSDFRPERLVLQGDLGSYVIKSIKVGVEEQMVAAGDFPTVAFEKDAIDTEVLFRTLNVGNKLVIQLESTAAGDITAGFVGTAIDK